MNMLGLYAISKVLNIPVIVLSQLNREAKQDKKKAVPSLETLSESDGVGQIATKVLGWESDAKIGSGKLSVIKNRYGLAGEGVEQQYSIDFSRGLITSIEGVPAEEQDVPPYEVG